MNKLVLPLTLVPPLPYLVAAFQAETVIIDAGEHYIKQTVRNRYHILGSNGVLALTIPVVGQKGAKVPSGNVEIDYSKPWLRNHLRAIEAAYRSAPFFEHYQDTVTDILTFPAKNLREHFERSFPIWLKLLKSDLNWEISTAHIDVNGDDLHRPFKSPEDFPDTLKTRPYMQVFNDRFEFKPNLSILDLLFNEGPAAAAALLPAG